MLHSCMAPFCCMAHPNGGTKVCVVSGTILVFPFLVQMAWVMSAILFFLVHLVARTRDIML